MNVDVHRRRHRRAGDRDVRDPGAGGAQRRDGVIEPRAHVRVEQVGEVAARNTEFRGPGKVRAAPVRVCATLVRERRRPCEARDNSINDRDVGNGRGEWPEVIERARQRDDALGRNLTDGRLQSNDAAGGGGDADGSARVAAERRQRHAGGDRNRRSAARPSRRPRRIDRIANGTERGVLARRAERELVEIGLANQHGARMPQLRDDRRIRGCDVPLAYPRRRRRRDARDVDQILDGDRHAVQRTAIAAGGELAIRDLRIAARLLRHHGNERVEPRLQLRDAAEALFGEFARGDFTPAELAGKFLDRHRRTKKGAPKNGCALYETTKVTKNTKLRIFVF